MTELGDSMPPGQTSQLGPHPGPNTHGTPSREAVDTRSRSWSGVISFRGTDAAVGSNSCLSFPEPPARGAADGILGHGELRCFSGRPPPYVLQPPPRQFGHSRIWLAVPARRRRSKRQSPHASTRDLIVARVACGRVVRGNDFREAWIGQKPLQKVGLSRCHGPPLGRHLCP